MKSRDDLVKEIATEIVHDKTYAKYDWASVSVTVRFEPPSVWKGGVLYIGDGFVRENPSSWVLSDRLTELRDLMTMTDGSEWVACLIKISALTQKIDIDFEYENARRWYLTPTMDPEEIEAYLMSLK